MSWWGKRKCKEFHGCAYHVQTNSPDHDLPEIQRKAESLYGAKLQLIGVVTPSEDGTWSLHFRRYTPGVADQPDIHIHIHMSPDAEISDKLDFLADLWTETEEEVETMSVDVSQLTAAIEPLSNAVDSVQAALDAQRQLLADALAEQGVQQEAIDAAVAAVADQTQQLSDAAAANLPTG